MIAPYIIEELERTRRQKSKWEPKPLYIEAPPPQPPRECPADESRSTRVIIIDESGEES